MSFKKLLVIIFLVAGLFVLVFAKKVNQHKESARIQEAELINLTAGLNAAAISKITLYQGAPGKNKIILQKSSFGWSVQKGFLAKARQDIVNNLVNQLPELKGNLRAEAKELFNDFRLSSEQALHIVLEDARGKILKHLLVSLLQPDEFTNFVREESSEKIILAEKNILSTLSLYGEDAVFQENNFLDLKVGSWDPGKVDKIKFAYGKKTFVISKIDADPAKINDFLGSAANLFASEIVDPALNIYGFDQPLLRIDFNDASQENFFQLIVGSYLSKEKAYYVQVLPSLQTFKISESSINNLKKDKAYFLKSAKKIVP